MSKLLKELIKLKDGFLKVYDMHYEVDGKDYNYELVSRNDLRDPSELGQSVNAVAIVPIFADMSVLVCREFRYAINDYCWEFPAGLIDPGESVEQAAARELKEETGLNLVEVILALPAGYSSAGMTDERVGVLFCVVDGDIVESDGKEEIHCSRMTLKEAAQIARSHSEQISCRFQLIMMALAMSGADDIEELSAIIKESLV